VEAEKRKHGLEAWIAFLVASVMILITANLLLHYSIGSVGGTLFDLVGEVLPYGLIAAIFVYYLLKSNIRVYKLSKPSLHGIRSSFARFLKLLFFSLGSVFLSLIVFSILFQGYQLFGGNIGITSPPSPTTPNLAIPAGAAQPLFDLWSLLSISTLVFVTVVLFSAVLLGRRREVTQETIDDREMEGTKRTETSLNRFLDDDDRIAVLAYYADGREQMVMQGVMLTDATTPREFEKNVLNSSRVAGRDFTPLTRLFEEARFSIHQVGGSEREKAKKHCEKLKKTSSVVRGQ
jgi:hypothetical protein